MKRAALLLTLFVAGFTAACSGGGNTPIPPPPPLGFSNSRLKGQFAFIMTGQAFDGGFLARVGVFIADGNGNIQGGTELVDTFTNNFQQLAFTGGTTYSVSSDGRGALTLLNNSGPTSYSITFTSPTGGYISETDGLNGASGTFELQDSTAFTQSALSGSYVFDVSGLDARAFPNTAPDSIIGQININSGVVQGGVYDENDAAIASGPVPITTGSLAITDNADGLGTLTFNNNFQYAFVVVNSRKFHMIEIPPVGVNNPITIGTANAQVAAPATNSAFNGNFAFLTAGVSVTSQDEKAGRFTTDGNGGLTLSSIALDDKLLGDPITQIPSGTLSAASYSIDTNFPGSGRGTVTFHDSSKGTYSFIFYMSSVTQGVIQDNSAGLVADGVIMAQTGTSSAITGDYAFNWSGFSTNSTNGVSAEEDFVGHVTFTSATSSNVTGAMDFSELNSNQGAFHDSALSGTLTINGDGTNSSGSRSGLTITAAGTNGAPSNTLKFTVYVVNPTTIFVVSQDTDRVTGGTFTKQVTPP